MPPYGYPQQRNTALLPPNSGQPLERATKRPQLPLQVRCDNTVFVCCTGRFLLIFELEKYLQLRAVLHFHSVSFFFVVGLFHLDVYE